MTSSQRLEKLIAELGLSKTEFAERVGKHTQNINAYTKGGRNVGRNFAGEIKKAFPKVNMDWLLYGTGKIFTFTYDTYAEKELRNELNYLQEKLDDLQWKYEQAINYIAETRQSAETMLFWLGVDMEGIPLYLQKGKRKKKRD